MKIKTIIWTMVVLVLVGWVLLASYNNHITMQEECNSKGVSGFCGGNSLLCANDCISLGKEYFRWNNGGFGSQECWCKLNNTVGQVW